MTVIGALSSFRELGEMSPHKRRCGERASWFQFSFANLGIISGCGFL